MDARSFKNRSEHSVTWTNAPGSGTVIDTQASANQGATFAFDVTTTVQTDGVHSFAIDTESANGVFTQAKRTQSKQDVRV